MSATSQLSLSTACLTPMGLPVVARAAHTAGYDGLELVLDATHLWRGADKARRAAADSPLPVLSVHQPLYHLGPWRRPARLIGDTVQVALALGARVVVLHSPWVSAWTEPYGRAWLAALETAQRTVSGSGLRLTVENLSAQDGRPMTTVLGNLAALASFCRQHGLGLTYDTCHAGTLGADLGADLVTVSDVLANVHLSDHRPTAGLQRIPVLDMMTANHQLPGEGALALRDALQTLARQGYSGPITFEVSPFALRSWRPARRRARLAQALAYAHEALAPNTTADAAILTAAVREPAE